MLFVDHNEAEVGELHIGAEQGVRADDDPSLARGCLKRCLPTAPRGKGPGDQHDAGRMVGASRVPPLASSPSIRVIVWKC